jgi:hypothetical protein
MKTSALYSGSGVPKRAGVGAKTVPLTLVVPLPGQVVCLRHRFVHGVAVPHTLAITWPHVWPLAHGVLQSSVPPQPSPILPQYCTPFGAVHEPGLHVGSPHRYEVPRPPQVSAPVQPGHVTVPPQPLPIVPQ